MMDKKAFYASLRSIKTTAHKLQPKLHELAMYALAQALEHGNCVPLTDMIQLPNSINLKGLAQWAVEFGPVTIKDGVVKIGGHGNKEKRENSAEWLAKADAMPFYEFQKATEGEVKPIDQLGLVYSALAAIRKAKATGKPVAGSDRLVAALESVLTEEDNAAINKRARIQSAE